MEATIIDPLAFELDVPVLCEKLRVRAPHRDEVGKLVAEAVAVARPRVTYKLAFIEAKGDENVTANGITFTSRVLRVNLDTLHRFFAFVGTAGASWRPGPTRSRTCSRISMPTRSTKRCCTRP